MKTVADTLGVSRSNLLGRLKGRSKLRGPYRKTEDAELLPVIQMLVDSRSTYDYRRITMLFNHERRDAEQSLVNAKRVHSIMCNQAMLLEKNAAAREDHIHHGKMMVVRSNLRWGYD